MLAGRAKFAAIILAVGLAGAITPLLARKKDKEKDKNAPPPSASTGSNERRSWHALNRLTFGPRPGDVQQVAAMGVDRWIDLQLHPEKIDNSALDARLEDFRTLRMGTKELAEDFPDNQIINQIKNGKKSMPSDAALRMIYQVQLARVEAKKEAKKERAQNNATAPPLEKTASVSTVSNNAKAAPRMAANNDVVEGANGAASAMNSGSDKPDSSVAPTDSASPNATASSMTAEEKEQAREREAKLFADLAIQQLPELPPDQRYKKILSMSPEQQLDFADTIRGGKAQPFLEGLNPKQKEVLQALNNPPGVVVNELMQAKLLRAIYSERQLEEVMTDFWFNHFNVFVEKGLDRLLITSYERDVIRPHALGKFEDLLVATAKSPAMLFYLDNHLSVGPDSAQALGLPQNPGGPYGRRSPMRPRPNPGKRPSGLNENYGRELLELHTLSVNGGYSQRDVTEVAKVFTGWTIDKPADGASFKFDPRMHEPGPKFVLGRKIKFKGEGEGLEVLHRLATNPQTAHFISLKLAQRFVSDDPPPALVDHMAKTFLKKKGDIREVLAVLFRSPEFWDDTTYRAKVKTPLEFVASAARATGANIDDAMPLARQLNNMGMPLYGAQPPTGYSMKAETWVSSSALLNRMNFALAFTNGKIKGATVNVAQLSGDAAQSPTPPDPAQTLSALENVLLDGDVSKQTHDSIAAQIASGATTPRKKPDNRPTAGKKNDPPNGDSNTMAGLLLGSPEFQKR